MGSGRRSLGAAVVCLGLGSIVAACQPVQPAPPPTTSTCQALPDRDHDGATEYFAAVDDGAGPLEAVPFEASTEPEKQAEVAEIEASVGEVVAVEPDAVVQTEAIDDPGVGNQWGIVSAQFETAWTNAGSQGGGTVVAVLDTGVQSTHEDLSGGVSAGADFVDGASSNGQNDLAGSSHGTHVAGILGARDNTLGGIGGAPGATILPVRVLNAQGSGSYSAVINGINWATSHNADVISMSLAGSFYSGTMQDTVTNAAAAGVLVVAAAGNAGSCAAQYPAALSKVVGVAATQQSPPDSLASYSQHGAWIDLAAPGSGVWSTVKPNNGYGLKSGTSMATPYVAAAAALLIAKCGAQWGVNAPTEVVNRLRSTSAPIGGNPIGAGALRAGAATATACV